MTTPKNQSDDLNDLIKHLDELVVEFSDVAKEDGKPPRRHARASPSTVRTRPHLLRAHPESRLLAMRHHHHAKKATQQNQSDELNDLTERRDELNTEISDIAKEMEKLGDEIIELARRRGKTNPEKAPQTPPGTTPPRFPE